MNKKKLIGSSQNVIVCFVKLQTRKNKKKNLVGFVWLDMFNQSNLIAAADLKTYRSLKGLDKDHWNCSKF